MQEENDTPYKKWDFLIGIILILSGGFRIYNNYESVMITNYDFIFSIIYILFGGYLVTRHFKGAKKK